MSQLDQGNKKERTVASAETSKQYHNNNNIIRHNISLWERNNPTNKEWHSEWFTWYDMNAT